MTSAQIVIATLKGRGAQFSVVGHQLEITAPDGVIDDEVRDSIKEHKNAIIDQILRESSMTAPPFPISNVQKRMSLSAKTSRHGDHVRSMHRFVGEIDKASMSAAVQVMIQRNPTLTIRFIQSDGEILQKLTPIGMFHIDEIELLDGEDSGDAACRYVERPFDMKNEPMFLVGMTNADESGTRHLVSVVHHALADGYANALITKTLSGLSTRLKAGSDPKSESRRALWICTPISAFNLRRMKSKRIRMKRSMSGKDLFRHFRCAMKNRSVRRRLTFRSET